MIQADVNARKKKEQDKLNDLQQFITDTPDIGKDIDSRLMYLYAHKKPYQNDAGYKEISNPNHYKIDPYQNWRLEEEQIRYIYNNLHTYKKVLHTSEGDLDVSNYFVPDDGFPQDPDDNVNDTLNVFNINV